MTPSVTASASRSGRTGTTSCQAFRGSLVAPCPNPATRTAARHGAARAVCPAHAS